MAVGYCRRVRPVLVGVFAVHRNKSQTSRRGRHWSRGMATLKLQMLQRCAKRRIRGRSRLHQKRKAMKSNTLCAALAAGLLAAALFIPAQAADSAAIKVAPRVGKSLAEAQKLMQAS